MSKKHSDTPRWLKLLESNRFFYGTLIVFGLQSAWIALSGRYPMAFDEDFHLGIIRLYAHHPYPFWSGQPVGANTYGAVARDPSYLFHYLMSFPYHLTTLLTSKVAIQVLCLRAIGIALLASGLWIFRKVLLASQAPRAVVHSCLLVFVLIPVVPMLGAQINYDNLLIPVVGLVLLFTIRIEAEMQRYKRINSGNLSIFLILCLLASLIKYAFLPIFVAVVLFLAIRAWQVYRSIRKIGVNLLFGLTLIERGTRWLLLIGLVVASGLFIERYGINLLRYHTPIPNCGKVLSAQACSAYGPWIRDFQFASTNPHLQHGIFAFPREWLHGMWQRLFFTVSGPDIGFITRAPFVVPAVAAIVYTAIGAATAVLFSRRLLRRYSPSVLILYVSVALSYITILASEEYKAYIRTGQPVAINGRYLLPILLPLILIGALGLNELLGRWRLTKALTLVVAVGCLLWGGGALTFILRSDASWYWHSGLVNRVNHDVRQTLGPITPGYHFPVEFLR